MKAERGCGITILGHTQNSPGQPGLAGPDWEGYGVADSQESCQMKLFYNSRLLRKISSCEFVLAWTNI